MASSAATKMVAFLLAMVLMVSGINALGAHWPGRDYSAPAPFGISGYEGYAEGVMRVDGTIAGHAFQHNGTVEEVFAAFALAYPDIDLSFIQNTTAPKNKQRALESRKANSKSQIYCVPVPGQDWEVIYDSTISVGITYLQGVTAPCNVGGRSCVRVSCSWDAGIYLCNDNGYEIFPTCPYIASYAIDLENVCTRWFDSAWMVGGQEFDTDGYNVIVKYAEEGC